LQECKKLSDAAKNKAADARRAADAAHAERENALVRAHGGTVSNPLNDDGVVSGSGDGEDDSAAPRQPAQAAATTHTRGHRVAGGRQARRPSPGAAIPGVAHTARFACAVVLVSGPSGLRFASDAHADQVTACVCGDRPPHDGARSILRTKTGARERERGRQAH
jgi:hypothetical protein